MTTLAVLEGGSKYRTKKSDEKKPVRPHCKVSIEDVNWVRKQSHAVQQLWLDCIAAEQFGGAHHTLDTGLSYNALSKGKKALLEKNLFDFKPIREGLPSGRSGVVGYQVQNLHGYYNKPFWELADTHEMKPETHQMKTEDHQLKPQAQEMKPESHEKKPESHEMKLNSPQPPTQQDFQNPNNVTNYEATTSQQPTKVVEEGVVQQREPIAPLGGALPEIPEPEKSTPSPEPAELPPQSLTSAELFTLLDNANNGICPPKELITSLLLGEYAVNFIRAINMNPQWGIEMKSTGDEKSLKNKQLRQQRKSQLRAMSLLCDPPNLQFLQDCWEDVLLKHDIKTAIANNPHWNIGIVAGELATC